MADNQDSRPGWQIVGAVVIQFLAAGSAALADFQIPGHHRPTTAIGATAVPTAQQCGQQRAHTRHAGIQEIGRTARLEIRDFAHAHKTRRTDRRMHLRKMTCGTMSRTAAWRRRYSDGNPLWLRYWFENS